MNSSASTQRSRQDASNLTFSTPQPSLQPKRQVFAQWLLVPMLVTPVTVIAIAAAYLSAGSLQASQNDPFLASELSKAQNRVEQSALEIEQAETQRDAIEQKYQVTLTQLQNTQAEHTELQTAYQDALKRLDTLKSQNQQQLPLLAERSTLKAQMKQLQESNQGLNNQVREQKLQLTTLQKRYGALENQSLQLKKDNQQLQIASSQLEVLKPELAKAHQTIERLSSQVNQKPDQMTTININGKQFPVTKELAAALKGESQKGSNQVERPTTEQQLPMTTVK
jgi:chromosome segregation ATPase